MIPFVVSSSPSICSVHIEYQLLLDLVLLGSQLILEVLQLLEFLLELDNSLWVFHIGIWQDQSSSYKWRTVLDILIVTEFWICKIVDMGMNGLLLIKKSILTVWTKRKARSLIVVQLFIRGPPWISKTRRLKWCPHPHSYLV